MNQAYEIISAWWDACMEEAERMPGEGATACRWWQQMLGMARGFSLSQRAMMGIQ